MIASKFVSGLKLEQFRTEAEPVVKVKRPRMLGELGLLGTSIEAIRGEAFLRLLAPCRLP